MPTPSGLVSTNTSPGLDVAFDNTLSGCTVPETESPYLGSLSSTVCPPNQELCLGRRLAVVITCRYCRHSKQAPRIARLAACNCPKTSDRLLMVFYCHRFAYDVHIALAQSMTYV